MGITSEVTKKPDRMRKQRVWPAQQDVGCRDVVKGRTGSGGGRQCQAMVCSVSNRRGLDRSRRSCRASVKYRFEGEGGSSSLNGETRKKELMKP